jgi:transketolase
VDGHDVTAVDEAYAEATRTDGRPTAVIARTKKGFGVAAVEDQLNAHGKPLSDPDAAIAELGGDRGTRVSVATPARDAARTTRRSDAVLPSYEVGSSVATRKVYGEALAVLGDARDDVVSLDGEVSNSTYSEIFREAHPERYFESFIAEQQMVASAVGMQVRGWVPFVSTFAAFLSRAYDFIRMAAISQAKLCLVGSHAGVSIGEDGPSQMALEDIASLRAVHGSTVLYPCDANQTAQLVALMADQDGISYLRTTRASTPVIYEASETFVVGGSRIVRSSEDDDVCIVAAGITLHEALRAADLLAADGVTARVVDAYSVKPLDDDGIRSAVVASKGRLVTVEDHWPEGGLGEAVIDSLARASVPVAVTKLAVTGMPTSGPPEQLLAAAGIDADHIVAAARKLVG